MPTLDYASMPTNLTEIQIREVAARQKAIIYCILGYVGLMVVSFAIPRNQPLAAMALLLCYLAMLVTAAICFFRLAIRFFHPVMAVLMMIVMVVPLLNLLVLLTVNGKAINLLTRNGVKVGLLGAR